MSTPTNQPSNSFPGNSGNFSSSVGGGLASALEARLRGNRCACHGQLAHPNMCEYAPTMSSRRYIAHWLRISAAAATATATAAAAPPTMRRRRRRRELHRQRHQPRQHPHHLQPSPRTNDHDTAPVSYIGMTSDTRCSKANPPAGPYRHQYHACT